MEALTSNLGHGHAISVIIHVWTNFFGISFSVHAWELAVLFVSGNTSHCLSTNAPEVIVVSGLKGCPRFVRVNVVSEVGHDVNLRQEDKHCLIVHHCPAAIKALSILCSSALVAFFKLDRDLVRVVSESKGIIILDDLQSVKRKVSIHQNIHLLVR